MRAAAATVGMVSAAVLMMPGCNSEADPARGGDPLRRASFRSLAAREFLSTCPGAAGRGETMREVARLEELRQLAVRKGASRAIGLGENDWAAVARYSDREPCQAGGEAYLDALAAFSATLDQLARRIAEHPQ
jgi:hypothetical protein